VFGPVQIQLLLVGLLAVLLVECAFQLGETGHCLFLGGADLLGEALDVSDTLVSELVPHGRSGGLGVALDDADELLCRHFVEGGALG